MSVRAGVCVDVYVFVDACVREGTRVFAFGCDFFNNFHFSIIKYYQKKL